MFISSAISLLTFFSLDYILDVNSNQMYKIKIAFLMERYGIMPKDYVRIGPAVDIALYKAKKHLPKSLTFEMNAYYVGKTCDKNIIGALGAKIYYKNPDIHLFLGPGCSLTMFIIGRMATDWNIAIISGSTTDNALSDTKIFKTLTRITFNRLDAAYLIKNLISLYKWDSLDVIYDECWQDVFHTVLSTYLRDNANVDVQEYELCANNIIENNEQLLKRLKGIRKMTKVVLISAKTPVVRQAMIIAHQLKMTNGDYVFLGQQTITAIDDPRIGWRRNDEFDEIARKAFESLLFIELSEPETEEYRNFTAEVKRRAKEDYNYTFGEEEEVTSFAADYHDCVYLYALALNECIAENCDPTDGHSMAKRMWNRTFKGIGGNVTLSEIGEKHSNYYVKDLNPETGKMEDVFVYLGDTAEFRKLKEIHWPNNRGPPKNEPDCGYTLDDTCKSGMASDPATMAAMGAMLGVMFIFLPVGFFVYRKRKLESQLSDMWWKVESIDIIPIVNEKATRNSTWAHLASQNPMDNEDTTEKKITITDKTVAMYQDKMVKLIYWNVPAMKITRDFLKEINQIRSLSHDNVSRLLGICLDDNNVCIILEYCTKGTLQEVLLSGVMELDWSFKFSLLNDIIEGMVYLHNSVIASHGYFNSTCCMINSRFMLVITGFGLPSLRAAAIPDDNSELNSDQLWRAPEYLREEMLPGGSQKGDVYSMAIIIQEIVTQTQPFDTEIELMGLEGVINEIKSDSNTIPFRPKIPKDLCPGNLQELMESCWEENPTKRPTFSDIKKSFQKINTNTGGIVDNLINRLENYAKNLESIVAEKTSALFEEKQKVEMLLYQLMPKFIADQLKVGNSVDPEHFDLVSLYFSDICGFTAISAASTPMQVVTLLNDLYTCFDSILEKHDVYKVETIGDAYIIVSGLPVRNGKEHAKHIANMSLELLEAVKRFKMRHRPDDPIRIRIGLHSGPCTSGIVGVKMPRYCLFGKHINFANSMESGGEPMKIHISTPLKELLDEFKHYHIELRGVVTIMKQEVTTYWLLERLDKA